MSASLEQEAAPYLERMRRERALPRLVERDATLWPEDQRAEALNRLGWLDLPRTTPRELPAWRALHQAAVAEGVEAILLVGMGGSSRGAAVLSSMLGRSSGAPSTTVCDSTHPDHVRPILDRLLPRRTWLVVATKSGTTAETRALAAVVRRWIGDGGGDPDRQSLAVTDAGSALTEAAVGWRAVITTPADVGGRFSALSAYGLLLPTLAGVDVTPVTDGAARYLAALTGGEAQTSEALYAMAARLAVAAREGRPLRIETRAGELDAWPGWLEQLLAESLGKAGVGLVPVAVGAGHAHGAGTLRADFVLGEGADEPPAGATPDPLLRVLPASGDGAPGDVSGELATALGAEMLTWELATSLVAWCLGTSPFDQPDVERSKRAARQALVGEREDIEPPLCVPAGKGDTEPADGLAARLDDWLEAARDRVYATVQLFAPPGGPLGEAVDALCGDLAAALGRTVTWGYGPRYLHSTGQLHKGGPPVAVLQLLVPPRDGELEVPGESFGLWRLLEAQAAGDAAALTALDRPVLRVTLDGSAEEAVEALRRAFRAAD